MHIVDLPIDLVTDELQGDTLLVFLLPECRDSQRLRDYVATIPTNPVTQVPPEAPVVFMVRTHDHPAFCDDFGVDEHDLPCVVHLQDGAENSRQIELDACANLLLTFC